jgi:hypothetical protein
MKSSAAAGDSCHVHSSLPLPTSDQVHGMGYSESEVETGVAALQLETFVIAPELEMDTTALPLETFTTALELEMDMAPLELETYACALNLETVTDMPQKILKQERYSTD